MYNIRKIALFTIDKFQGNKLRDDLNNIRFMNEHYFSDQSRSLREKYLKSLLNHVVSTVPYYQNKSGGKMNLQDFPVVNKNIIRERLHDFLSHDYDISELSKTTTSGSTGTPFTIYRDKRKMQRHRADVIYFNQLAHCDIGDKIYYFRVWNSINQKSLIQRIKENIETIDISSLSYDNMKSLIQRISQYGGDKVFLGFSSAFEEISRKFQGQDLSGLKVKSIITMSESLSDVARENLTKVFACPVLSRYSNMENGLLSMQVSNNPYYYLNTASYYFEILSLDSDVPVKEGALGRIVVTDLFNKAMPLIRYDTGDLGTMVYVKGRPYFSVVSGRKSDAIYSTSGELLSSHVVTNTMWKFTYIKQFQFIQNDAKSYTLVLNLDESYKVYVKEIVDEFKSILGDDAIFHIEYKDEIPVLNSGKRKYIINNYK